VSKSWIAGLLLGCALAAWGEETGTPPEIPIEWSFTGELTLRPDRIDETVGVYDRLNTVFRFDYRYLRLLADLSLVNDERYEPSESYMLGRNFAVDNGGLALDFGFLSLSAGRFVHRDFLDTPYSLFVSSERLPALLADITLRARRFTYESRWIRLNTRSANYPDRGANYKVFALELGDWRFGLQDAAVYYGRVFDEEYFLSPIPNILTQMVTKRDDTPWKEDANDNSIMGLFVEWNRPRSWLYAQWLVDDISLDFLIPWFLRDKWGHRRVASKLAWSIGGRWELPFGTLGFYHAGATKYTFEATYDSDPYGYTYYPAVEYDLGGSMVPLDYRDNYLGYKYGENNLAFRAELTKLALLGADCSTALEYVLSGSKSPANPWHGEPDPNRTRMFDEAVLEQTVLAEAAAAWAWRSWSFYTRLKLGVAFNRLELAPAPDLGPQILQPHAGENAALYAWTVGVTYLWQVGRRRGKA
jgi:hypothetical protein